MRPVGPSDLIGLKAALDAYQTWPTIYVFKFIVPQGQLSHLLALLDGLPISTRDSSTGRYTSVTIELPMQSSTEVIAVYERVVAVEGLMAM